jgi:hypothetical protein
MSQGDRDFSQSVRTSLYQRVVMYDCPDFIVVRVSTHPERDKSSTASISSPRTTQGRYSVPRLTKTDMLIPPTPKMYFAKYLLYTLWYIPPGGIHLISASKRGVCDCWEIYPARLSYQMGREESRSILCGTPTLGRGCAELGVGRSFPPNTFNTE